MPDPTNSNPIDVVEIDDLTVVNFNREIDLDENTVHPIGDQLFKLVENAGNRRFLLNFRNVNFVSSAGVAKLIALSMKVKKNGGRLIVASVKPAIREVFTLLKLNKLFDFEEK